jgi:hypothetical protein
MPAMRLIHRLPAAALALVLSFACTAAYAAVVGDIVNQVSQSSYTDYLNNRLYTHNGSNRGVGGTQHDQARAEIANAFTSFGLTTTLDDFTYNSSTYYNVVGVLPGKVHPNQYYIVGAHYDSVNNPGADDNASGTAGVMEAARVLSKYQFDATLVFVGFDREEQGLVGAYAYAAEHAADDIRGMISMDMIAYNPTGSSHDQALVCYYTNNAKSVAMTTKLSNAITQYSDITPVTSSSGGSDHVPFYNWGSALLIERACSSNPNYHKAADSVDTAGYIDYAYATDMTSGVVGYLATEALVVPEPSTLVLLAIGVFGMLVYARRNHRNGR